MTHDFSMDWQELWLAVIYLVLEANMEVYDLLIIEHINIFIHISIHISVFHSCNLCNKKYPMCLYCVKYVTLHTLKFSHVIKMV